MKTSTIHAILIDAIEIAVNTDLNRRMYPAGTSPFYKQKCGRITFHRSSVEPVFAFWKSEEVTAAVIKVPGLAYDRLSGHFTYTPSSLS